MSVEQVIRGAEVADLNRMLERHIPCDGPSHPVGRWGHKPDQHAEYRVTAPCCGLSLNVCAGWVLAAASFPRTLCSAGCGRVVDTADILVREL